MRNVSCLQGSRDLENIRKYALDFLTRQERLFIERMTRQVEAFVREETEEFLTLGEIVKLLRLWSKYFYLKPFQFAFDPREKIPKVFQDQTAFVIWTVWRSFHLLGEEDLEGAALAAANVLSEFRSPYSSEIKEKAVKRFRGVILNTGYNCPDDLSISFWEAKIFPYLEGVWEFKWEVIK